MKMLAIIYYLLFPASLCTKPTEVVTNTSLQRTINNTEISEETLLDYVFGNETDPKRIDINLLESDNLREIIASAIDPNVRRASKVRDEIFQKGEKYTPQILDLMKQSIYSTRYRLEDTRRFRKKYRNDPAYQAAVFYGALLQLQYKLDRLYNTMRNFKHTTKFIWYLVIYERIVQTHVDVCDMVERVFNIRKSFVGNEGQAESDGDVNGEIIPPKILSED